MFVEIPASRGSIAKRKKILGVATNDATYLVENKGNNKRVVCPFYRKWMSMINRCYSKRFHCKHESYKDCYVCDEWLLFSKFKSWMEKQDWKGKELDKDILIPGNKVYSPDTCVFVPQEINKLIANEKVNTGEHPVGIHFNKSRGKFMAKIKIEGVSVNLGRFNNAIDAELAYLKAKYKNIMNSAANVGDLLVSKGLVRHADLLLNRIKVIEEY